MEDPALGCGQVNEEREAEICRLCMKTQDYYLNVFVSNEDFKMSIGKAIEDLLVLEVSEGDSLPETVCCPCVTKLMEFQEFKEMCMNSARVLGRHAPMEPITCAVKVEIEDDELVNSRERKKWNEFVEDQGSAHGESKALKTGVKDVDAGELPEEHAEIGEEEDLVKKEYYEGATVYIESSTLALEDQTGAKDVDAGELPEEHAEIGEEEDPVKKEYFEGATVYIESSTLALGDKCQVKEELVEEEEEAVESMVGVKCEITEDEDDDNFPSNAISGIDSDPLDVGQMINEKTFESSSVKTEVYSFDESADTDSMQYSNASLEAMPLASGNEVDQSCTFGVISNVTGFQREAGSEEISQTRASTCQQGIHSSSKELKCKVCGKIFCRRSHLNRHVLLHTGLKPFQCNICGKTFAENGNLKKHATIHSDIAELGQETGTAGSSQIREFMARMAIRSAVKELKCEVCAKVFGRRSHLNRHLLLHTGLKPYKCDVCGRAFAENATLKKHKASVHRGNDVFVDIICANELVETSTYISDSAEHSVAKEFKCDECGKVFGRSGHLKRHAAAHSGLKPFECDVCGRAFAEKGTLKKHAANVHSGGRASKKKSSAQRSSETSTMVSEATVHPRVKQFKCDICGKVFGRMNHLKRHAAAHSGVKPFECDVCGRAFGEKGTLKKHAANVHAGGRSSKKKVSAEESSETNAIVSEAAVHSGVNEMKCPVCEEVMASRSELNGHAILHAGSKPFKCATCGETFAENGDLEKHAAAHSDSTAFESQACVRDSNESSTLPSHSGWKAFECDQCGKRFNTRRNLKRHSIIHTGARPFKCAVCGKQYSEKGSLKVHAVVHTGLKPFKCDTCGKGFSRKSTLDRHIGSHVGWRPFKCDICGRDFSRASHLKEHSLCHTGVRPFKCDFCAKEFTLKKTLKNHLAKYGETKLTCDACGRGFHRKRDLEAHCYMVHSIKDLT